MSISLLPFFPRPAITGSMIDRSARLLERALLFSFVIHGVAMLSMAFLLLPGMPGGGTADDVARMRHVAAHPWLWRLGWFPWQLTALSDLLIGIGLLPRSTTRSENDDYFLSGPLAATSYLDSRSTPFQIHVPD